MTRSSRARRVENMRVGRVTPVILLTIAALCAWRMLI